MTTGRIYVLDCLRFVAVTLAIVSHIVIGLNLWDSTASLTGILAKVTTRSATPSLLILFGLMIEIVQARRYETDPGGAPRRAISRSLDCAFVLILVAAIDFVLNRDVTSIFRYLVLQDDHFEFAIFRLYVVILLLVPAMLWLNNRIGAWTYVATIAVVLIYDAATRPITTSPPYHAIGALFGLNSYWGPGAVHSLVFVVFGMSLGAIYRRRSTGAAIFAAFLMLASVAIVGIYIIRNGIMDFMLGVNELERFRGSNDAEYFAYGILSFGFIFAISWLFSLFKNPAIMRLAFTTGSHTLTYFFMGNVIINLAVKITPDGPIAAGIAAVGILLASILSVQCWVWLTAKPWVRRLIDGARDTVLNHIGLSIKPPNMPKISATPSA